MRHNIASQMARRVSDQDIILDYRMTVRALCVFLVLTTVVTSTFVGFLNLSRDIVWHGSNSKFVVYLVLVSW